MGNFLSNQETSNGEHEHFKTDEKEQTRLNDEIAKIERSLKKEDLSEADYVEQFANVVELDGMDKMNCVSDIVDKMGAEWSSIMEDENSLVALIGQGEMRKLKDARYDYFSLLLKTRTIIVGLIEQSRIIKGYVAKSRAVVKKAQKNGDDFLSDTDRLVYDASMKRIFRWIDQKELEEIMKEWNLLCKRLEAQKGRLRKIFETFKKQSLSAKILMGIGAVVLLGAFVTLVISTHIVALTIAAGVGIVAELLLCGGLFYGYYVKPPKMLHKIQTIIKMLNDYIETGRRMQLGVANLQAKTKQIEKRLKFTKDVCESMLRPINKIDKYLDNYIKQGNELVCDIKCECEKFIGKKENSKGKYNTIK